MNDLGKWEGRYWLPCVASQRPHTTSTIPVESTMDLQVQKIFAIALGGALGAVCRYAITMAAFRTWGEWFPLGVLIANVLGCFLLGLLMHDAVVAGKWLPTAGHAALTIGLLGA